MIDPLVHHMEQWELHSLRGVVTVLLAEVVLYARKHPEAKELAAATLATKKNHDARQLLELQLALVRDITDPRGHAAHLVSDSR